MENNTSCSRNANDLRKAGNFIRALEIYQDMWKNNMQDEFVAGGLLHCLRKLHRCDEAFTIAWSVITRFPESTWVKNESIWAIVDYVKQMANNGASAGDLHTLAERIFPLDPPALPLNQLAFPVMKAAKSEKIWNLLLFWTEKVDPASLNPVGIKLRDGKEGWSYLAHWYHYRVLVLTETGNPVEAISLSQQAIQKFPNRFKDFAYELAKAYCAVKDYQKAEATYQDLCQKIRPDYYHLFEYGKVLQNLNRPEEALVLMGQAAKAGQRLEYMVGYFVDMGDIFRSIGRTDAARDHYMFATAIRMRKSWPIPPDLQKRLNDMEVLSIDDSVEELQYRCSMQWHECEGLGKSPEPKSSHEEQVQETLVGTIFLGPANREYFFINPPESDGYIGFKNELPEAFDDRSQVKFDVVPTFNKKRNEWSTKAVNVRPIDSE